MSAAAEPAGPLGPSTHIATDIWTLEDSLGYRAYAYAIARFMTHPHTRPPLTISIQAPWGGGKTSLMRMIQKQVDPAAVPGRGEEEAPPERHRRGALTVRQALAEVQAWITAKTERELPPVPEKAVRETTLLTVWFNAWKYESTNQVWAGLADAIMQQVAARLDLVEQEKFWLRLNLKRVDPERIRQKIYDKIFRGWLTGMRWWGLGLGVLFLASLGTLVTGHAQPGVIGMLLSTLATGIAGAGSYLKKKREVEQEPAAASLGQYLDIPDYSKELGFIHHVEADLQRVLACVPEQYQPLVIFVDDLDRCSPAKVAQLVEAVNLFLAGDFQKCIFVLGMDSEMVAAALQAAHRDMIANLPADAGIPVGWRFMDKFVQLPFLIPPTAKGDLENYLQAMLAGGAEKMAPPVREAVELATVTSAGEVDEASSRLQQQFNLTEDQKAMVRDSLAFQVDRQTIDAGIARFTDDNPEIRGVIKAATRYFRGNPREMKRFLNVFRFHYFLMWARRDQEKPSLEQLLRWTVLTIKWPEVVRWLRRSGGGDWRAASNALTRFIIYPRLKLLEDISGTAADLQSWQDQALKELHLDAAKTVWLQDDDLWQFFHEEFQLPAAERLSAGAGKGLW